MPRACAAIATSLALSFCAAWKAAPPSMIAMRLPTGVLLGNEVLIVGARKDLVDHRVVIAAVIGAAARDRIRKLLPTDEVAPPHLQPVETERVGDLLDGALDRVVRGRLAEGAHRLLHGL